MMTKVMAFCAVVVMRFLFGLPLFAHMINIAYDAGDFGVIFCGGLFAIAYIASFVTTNFQYKDAATNQEDFALQVALQEFFTLGFFFGAAYLATVLWF